MSSLSFLILFLWAVAVPVSATPKSIFILAGQSNMAGRGGVVKNGTGHLVWDGIIPSECQSSPSIFRLTAKLQWEEAKEPLHVDIDVTKACGVGPGMPFAHEVLKRYASLGVIGLVPCAIGGTSMVDWGRGTKLYTQMMKRASAGLRGGGKIRALLWYQGESEAIEGIPNSFAEDLRRFFTSVRKDLRLLELPIIQVALSPEVKGNYTKEVRKSQLRLRLPLVKTVDAKGLQLQCQQSASRNCSSSPFRRNDGRCLHSNE